ncbi:MAG: hypothetical protein HY258_10570 [Chloroflexi bacterium]|nr:hypothetical protein [Chloroflexota bacterium]
MKTISILLALVNSLAAGLVIAASLPAIQILHPASSLWNATKVMASLGVIVIGVLTWIRAGRLGSDPIFLLAGLFLVALGTACAVWTIHLGLVNGILKNQMFLYGGSLMMQGASSIWSLLPAEGKSDLT